MTMQSRVGEPDPGAVLHEVFGFSAFRGQQEAIVRCVVAGGDALVVMPTGSGKSLCYQLPALLRAGTAVVVSPLIALMEDQVTALRALGIRAEFLNSSLPRDEQDWVRRQTEAGDVDLL
jgi:ATP-dependent DNA helicase RecQ